MKILSSKITLVVVAVTLTLAAQTTTAQERLPNPSLNFLGQEYAEKNGKKLTYYHFEVVNRDKYPAELFIAAPDLPPCGSNTKASRTWVEIYAQNGKYISAFCAFTKPDDLSRFTFALEQDEVPPSWVYIEIKDRKTNTKYKSNLAETTM